MTLKRYIKTSIVRLVIRMSSNEWFYSASLQVVRALPAARIIDRQTFLFILNIYQKVCSLLRHIINNRSSVEREYIAITYLIPVVNMLFDKNYVNYAQFLLLTLEEYFLSKDSEESFEEVLALFSAHAVAAGERFREKFPLPYTPRVGEARIGIVGHSVAISGYEVVMTMGEHMAPFHPKMFAMRTFDTRTGLTTKEAFQNHGITLVLTKRPLYDVFALRQLILDTPVDVAVWPMPPFHMFFFFAFGLAPKQVWFSQYLRPRLAFSGLDDTITLGGCGTKLKKRFNNREWNIVPQIVEIQGLEKRKYLFTPARLEKLKQPEFMECVAEILRRDKSAHFKWTGYHLDAEVEEFFRKKGLGGRHTYIMWLDGAGLIHEIKTSHAILASFPLSLGTVENIAAHHGVPIISLYDEEKNLYWRDIYWEATEGNPTLQKICLNADGSSKILIARTPEEYIDVALRVIREPALAKTYAEVYKQAHDYTYLKNQNDIAGIWSNLIHGLYAPQKKQESNVT